MINHADSQKNINSSVTNIYIYIYIYKRTLATPIKFLSIVASKQVRNDSLSDPEPEGV